jgi:CRISPR-associated exonuclease Cas4
MQGYSEEDLLPLSGIQHIAFCERQWALIHVEGQWKESVLTVEGKHIHERVDQPFTKETRGDFRITRSVPLISRTLGLRGLADVIEYMKVVNPKENETIRIEGRAGRWKVRPVEYKRGKPKPGDWDLVQLCAQAMALEEMLSINIPEGYLYYNEIRRRVKVAFDDLLRNRVKSLANKMHWMTDNRFVPTPKKEKHCLRCSIYEICQPDWSTSDGVALRYISNRLMHLDEDSP